jgi:hypothetical protein
VKWRFSDERLGDLPAEPGAERQFRQSPNHESPNHEFSIATVDRELAIQ